MKEISDRFRLRDIFSWSNCEDAEKYLGKVGFYADNLRDLKEFATESDSLRSPYELRVIQSDRTKCFGIYEYGRWHYFSLFLPLDLVKEKKLINGHLLERLKTRDFKLN